MGGSTFVPMQRESIVDKSADWLQKTLGYEFQNPALFQEALTHRSAARRNNERREFLGDAVLDFVVSELVFQNKPDANEGDLSRWRASLVNDAHLAELAASIGLGEHLILGSGEKKTGGNRRGSILADALEAIFAAVYVDAGFTAAEGVIRRLFGPLSENLPDAEELKDPKTRLQELLQADGYDLPIYKMEKVTGKAHKQSFEVSCRVMALDFTTQGHGSARRDAEQDAAAAMIARIKNAR